MHVIVVQGGASVNACTDMEKFRKYNDAVISCAKKGYDVLQSGGTAIDAVEAAVRALEDDCLFNAGTGSCLTSKGTVEMDAMIMDGESARLGAVGCVDCTDHPISLARAVMEHSPHCMLVNDGAREFAKSCGYPVLDSIETLITEQEKINLAKYKDFASALKLQMNVPKDGSSDTVGAVALDGYGNMACATSTGGICGKLPGRIGDGPLVGCGGYANKIGAASCTGHGESLMRLMCCRTVIENIEKGKSPQDAAKACLNNVFEQTNSCGGVVCLDKHGNIGVHQTAEFMPWASISSESGTQSFHL